MPRDPPLSICAMCSKSCHLLRVSRLPRYPVAGTLGEHMRGASHFHILSITCVSTPKTGLLILKLFVTPPRIRSNWLQAYCCQISQIPYECCSKKKLMNAVEGTSEVHKGVCGWRRRSTAAIVPPTKPTRLTEQLLSLSSVNGLSDHLPGGSML